MGLFDFMKMPDIRSGLDDYRSAENAVLLDVRTAEEFREGHIPGSINLPLDEIAKAETMFSKTRPVFTYCRSGARSGRAAAALKQMGFSEIRNIGGILDYKGRLER